MSKKEKIEPVVELKEVGNSVQQSAQEESFIENKATAADYTEQELTEMVEKLIKMGKKIIKVDPLSVQEKGKIAEVVTFLEELEKEVLLKKNEILSKRALIKERVDGLITSGKIQINREEFDKTEDSVHKYAELLDNIMAEINNEKLSLQEFLNESMQSAIVNQYESDDFSIFIENKVVSIGKYIKNIRKDLNISYSRYSFGFEAQLKRIMHVESFVRYQNTHESNK